MVMARRARTPADTDLRSLPQQKKVVEKFFPAVRYQRSRPVFAIPEIMAFMR